jgi:molybdate transport system substrate-binding protein
MTRTLGIVLVATILAVGTWFLTAIGIANAADLKILSPQVMRSVLDEIVPRFERLSGNQVTISYATTSSQVDKIEAGIVADLAILSPEKIKELQDENKIVKNKAVSIAKIEFGVIVRKGATKPDVSTVRALKQALISAKSIAAGNPEASMTGEYFDSLIERLQIANDIRPKTKLFSSGTAALQAVASGEAEIAVGVVSAGIEPGTEFAGALPAQAKKLNSYAVGILTSSNQIEAAKALALFISSPASLAVFKSKGFAAP